MSWQTMTIWVEKITRRMLLIVGCSGVLVIYGGFFYLLLNGLPWSQLPWIFLLSPWVCIYFGLSHLQQVRMLAWFMAKLSK
ncbi:MAG: hypothetical protein ACRDBI_02055 [Shewanella sp.]